MILSKIKKLNKNFQERSMQLSKLTPSGSLYQATSTLLRSSRKIHDCFIKLMNASSEAQFNTTIDRMEEEMDEVVFILDQMEMVNKKQKISLIEGFLKEGYGLISVYSKCCDHIIEKKVTREKQWTV